MMSFESTTKSARFPGVIDPKIFSVNDAHAGSRVIPDTRAAHFSCHCLPCESDKYHNTPFNASSRVRRCSGNLRQNQRDIPRLAICPGSDSPPPWPVRGSAIRRKPRDGSEESGQWIHGFDRCIRPKGKPCTVIDDIAESVERLHTFWTLRSMSGVG